MKLLPDLLAELIDYDQDGLRHLATFSGLPAEQIRLSGKPVSDWMNLLNEAHRREKLVVLVDTAIRLYELENKRPDLEDALQSYWNLLAQSKDASHSQGIDVFVAAVRDQCLELPYQQAPLMDPHRTLPEIFVSPSARYQPDPSNELSTGENAEADGTSGEDRSISAKFLPGIMSSENKNGILVVGEPGSGKSTLLRYIALYSWHEPTKVGLPSPHIPCIFSAKALSGSTGASIEERLGRAMEADKFLLLPDRLPEHFVREWQAQSGAPWLVLIDGLDEIQNDFDRSQALGNIFQLRKLLSKIAGKSHRQLTSHSDFGYNVSGS